jgi:hypothetical protein
LKLTPAQESCVHPRKQNEKDLEVLRVLEVWVLVLHHVLAPLKTSEA